MTKHVADQRRTNEGGRTRSFIEIERSSGPEGAHPAARQALRQPRPERDDSRRMTEFLRIARGQTA